MSKSHSSMCVMAVLTLSACVSCSDGASVARTTATMEPGAGRDQIARNASVPRMGTGALIAMSSPGSWHVVPTPANEVPVVMIERIERPEGARRIIFPKRGTGYAYVLASLNCRTGGYSVRQSYVVPSDGWRAADSPFTSKGNAPHPRMQLNQEILSICKDGGGMDVVSGDVQAMMRVARKEEARTLPSKPPVRPVV